MLAGGTTDIIAHFAGHLRLMEEVPRLRDHYEDPALLRPSRPWLPETLRTPDPVRDLDELLSRPLRAPLSPDEEAFPPFGRAPMPGAAPPPASEPAQIDPPSFLLPQPSAGGGGRGGGARQGEAAPDLTPDQVLVQILQLNALRDDDRLLMVADADPSHLHDVDIDAALQALRTEAASSIPAELILRGPSTDAAIDMVLRWEAASSGGQDGDAPEAGAQEAELGTYVDGVLQPAGTALAFAAPERPETTAPVRDGLTDPGLVAHAGGNLSVNAASILDNHGNATSLAVMGDAYTLDAIVQVNVLASRAAVSAAGETLARSIATDGNEAGNAARIADHDISGLVQRVSLGTNVTVDRIDGDFFGVNLLRQANLLHDNDVTVQGSFGAYYVVRAGENDQTNVMRLIELGSHYDLIVVEGDYHSANIILQRNILLNDDAVLAYTARGDGVSQSITTGGNTLENTAAIDRYGSDTFRPLSATLGNSLDDLQEGFLSPDLAAAFPASGLTLRVLYVTGDFYDINVIEQTNVVSDVDTLVQHSPGSGAEAAPDGRPTHSVQAAHSGENHLANLAAITNVGTTSDAQFVGGAHYDDAILIQANFMSEASHVTVGDPGTLVPEIVAFTGLAEPMLPEPASRPVVTAASGHSEDLFHGMLS
jgi:hypothetical protein